MSQTYSVSFDDGQTAVEVQATSGAAAASFASALKHETGGFGDEYPDDLIVTVTGPTGEVESFCVKTEWTPRFHISQAPEVGS